MFELLFFNSLRSMFGVFFDTSIKFSMPLHKVVTPLIAAQVYAGKDIFLFC